MVYTSPWDIWHKITMSHDGLAVQKFSVVFDCIAKFKALISPERLLTSFRQEPVAIMADVEDVYI